MEKMNCKYPTIANIKRANESKLHWWRVELPQPQTDVERACWNRINKRIKLMQKKNEQQPAPPSDLFGTLFGDIK